jgi:hypothetical protein
VHARVKLVQSGSQQVCTLLIHGPHPGLQPSPPPPGGMKGMKVTAIETSPPSLTEVTEGVIM